LPVIRFQELSRALGYRVAGGSRAIPQNPFPSIAMIASFLLTFISVPAPAPVPVVSWFQEDAEVDAQIAAAGKDAAKLMELAASLKTAGKDDAAKKVFKKVIEIDPNHAEARKELRHHNYDGKWFESYAELSKYRREETAKMKEKGLVKWKDQWVPEADKPYMDMGWEKDAGGKWVNPVEVAREKQISELRAAGHEFRADDSSWVAPNEMDKWRSLLWKCGTEWLDMAKADEFHSRIGQWWVLDGEHFTTTSTTDWMGANEARAIAETTYADLKRLFGMNPAKKPHFIVLNSIDQYNKFSAGDQELQLPPSESEGFSSLHYAYFADVLFDPSVQPPQFAGCGVAFWDRKGPQAAFGPYAVRFAAAQSFCEAIDPSWNAVAELIASISGGAQPNAGAFWTEKRIPRWLRYGAASYVERFAKMPAGDGGNPWANREWAMAELKKKGGIRKVEDIFSFPLDLNDLDGSGRLYHEAGLVVSFLLDGADGDKKLRTRHDAFKAMLKATPFDKKKFDEAVKDLQDELAKNERDIKKFADL
jgi:tetratricopeptide (TPR) repeat protein